MSDTHRRYHVITRAPGQVMPVASGRHREKHLNTLTSQICGLVVSRHSHLSKMADHVPRGGAKRESQIKRFQRWLTRAAVSCEVYYLPVAQALLQALAAQPLRLVIDGSAVGRGCMGLMLSVLYQRRALPLVWTVVHQVKGHLPQTTHCALVERLAPLPPPQASGIFLGDGEVDGTDLRATIHGDGWHYVCRTAANTWIWCGARAFQISDFTLEREDAFALTPVHMTATEYGPILALGVWEAAYDHLIYLVTHLTDPEAAPRWYRRRAIIETLFQDHKSRGFRREKSHRADPSRLLWLLIAVCLAYRWIVYLETLAHGRGYVAPLQRSDRCDLGLFQLGLACLAYLLKKGRPLPVAFKALGEPGL